MNTEISCPFSTRQADETIVRIVAFMVFTITLAGIFTFLSWVTLALSIDFSFRALTAKPGFLAPLGKLIAKLFNLPPKPINAGPKIFAARLGLFFCITITIVGFLGWTTISIVLAGLLCFFAALEAFFSICVGCHLYTILLKLQLKS